MNQEHPNIANEDWRLQGVTTLAKPFLSFGTGESHPVGTPVYLVTSVMHKDKELSFHLPNTTALFLDFAHNLWLESEHSLNDAEFIKKINDEELFNILEMRMGAIVFSYTAIESFANEKIPKEYVFELERDDKKCTERYNKEQVERNVNLETKLCLILPNVLSVKSPKGGKMWSNYKALKDLRDRIIHMKSIDKRSSGSQDNTIWRELMNLNQPNFAVVANKIITHYVSERDMPRWIAKSPLM